MVLDRDRLQGAEGILPEEYRSAADALAMGDVLLRQNEPEEANEYFHLAWTKAMLLESNLAAEKQRRAEADRLKAEADRREHERLEAEQAEQRRLAQQRAAAEQATEIKAKAEKPRQAREKPLPVYHTVKRGETLPQIAAQAEVYNDQSLWPLLYRANRDQIRDPRHIWPGQVLRIPRNFSREEAAEARRYSRERPLR